MFRAAGTVALFALIGSLLPAADEPAVPAPPREFRGVWVAAVANIDWPSKPGMPTASQQQELLAILDKAQGLNLNAVILHVRPMCDALYPSKLEPWSEFLTGQAGQPPEPAWDPLAFAVEQAHRRGLELHAWFNPYRARHPSAKTELPADHLVKRRPDLAKPYGKHHWLNPTNKEVQDHTIAVFLDVVNRYDIDGIHIDDYFYPYPELDENKKEIPFPDDDTWEAYKHGGGTLTRDDWRRDAVNRFIERMYAEVKKAKPWVKVGISPFGIWKPGHPPGIEGFNQHDKLYADARLWVNRGWGDYFCPQLYWPVKSEKQSYPKLLKWWVDENTPKRHMWPGNYTSKYAANEIVEQIEVTRKQPGATGNTHFSMKAIGNNTGGIADALAKAHPDRALVPASPWLGDKKPGRPELAWEPAAKVRTLRVRPGAGEPVRQYVVRQLVGGKWKTDIRGATDGIEGKDGKTTVFAEIDPAAAAVVVTAVSRTGIESDPARLAP